MSSFQHTDVLSVTFSLYTSEEIKKISVLKICTPLTFNSLGHPLPGGLYDPVLGPVTQRSDPCKTCLKNIYMCPGHLGHIELPLTVVNPLFYKHIYLLIRASCLSCYTFQMPDNAKYLMLSQLRLVNAGYITEIKEAENILHDVIGSHDPTYSDDEALGLLLKERLDQYEQSVFSGSKAESDTLTSKNIEALRNRILDACVKNYNYKKCKCCHQSIKKVTMFQNRLFVPVTKVETADKFSKDPKSNAPKSKSGSTMIYPEELRDHLRRIWENNKELIESLTPVLKYVSLDYPTDLLFLDVVPVTPGKARPVNFVNGRLVEHPQTEIYKRIVQDAVVLRNILKVVQDDHMENLTEEGKMVVTEAKGATPLEKLNIMLQQVQGHIDHLLDSSLNPSVNSGPNITGIKQLLEKKQGVIRMNMMGKRVNYAARSVITPDPNLDIDEVGIPEEFAKTLTYPTYVTHMNVKSLEEMIKNGPLIHPGAVLVETYDGSKIKLSPKDETQRKSIASRLLSEDKQGNKKGIRLIYRHLMNGDILLINRQPTLHKPSIMAHCARILKGEKTLRLHYANCKAYNADFDGDEMNAHFVQNELARSEAFNLVHVNNQYAVPKDGTPLAGLIQDHVISGVKLSIRGRFFNKQDYCQLVFQGLSRFKDGNIVLLPPAIIKPVQLWSGKQILSTILINSIPKGQHLINMNGTSKIPSKAWEFVKPRKWKCGGTKFTDPNAMSEGEVIIRGGELLCGVLDKMHYGATPYGLVHSLYELYGGNCSSKVLSSFSRLFTYFLQRSGFTLGIEDILLVEDAEYKRKQLVIDSRKVGDSAVVSALELESDATDRIKVEMEEFHANYEKAAAIIDHSYKVSLDGYTNNINKACIPGGLLRKFPENNLQLMIQSGAKGSTVNAMQISCLLGQIELEGKRPPLMKSYKSLPSFAKFDTTPRSGGFIDGRFLSGIQPQEFFFHCMAGREGLIDTAVKTSRSGYLQRCLIKHLEGLVVHYDQSVRDSDGSVIQYCYGEDGRDVLKAQFLNKDRIPFLVENHKAIIPQNVDDIERLSVDHKTAKGLRKQRRKINKWIAKFGSVFDKHKTRPFQEYSMSVTLDPKPSTKIKKKTGRSKLTEAICKSWWDLEPDIREEWRKKHECPDPVTTKYRSGSCFGALTEQLEHIIQDYIENRPTTLSSDTCWDMINHKSIISLVHPGEPVGLLAAQSIGEPSTQMTLNTFHFAGRGEMNVTLGIPRLREILMYASKTMKTPSMDIPFKTEIRHLKSKAEKLRKKLSRVAVADVLQRAIVSESLLTFSTRERRYHVRLEFLPHATYKCDFSVTPHYVLRHIEKKFIKHVLEAIKKNLNLKHEIFHFETTKKRKMNADTENENNDNEADIKTQDEPDSEKVNNAAAHESSDEESEEEEEDAKKQAKPKETQEYDSEGEDDDEDVDDPLEEDKSRMVKAGEDEVQDSDSDNEFEANVKNEDSLNVKDEESPKMRQKYVTSINSVVKNYVYDTQNELWCEITFGLPLDRRKVDMSCILKDVARKSIVSHVPDIKRAFTYVNPDTQLLTLKTDGINIQSMFEYSELLDLNKLYSNDIYQVSQRYGIEAARKVLIKEVQDVFRMYGIIVDPRHLLLIADYMTFSGSFEPLSRKGIEDHTSSLQQMSFEACLGFLRTATLRGKSDTLKSPSSRIMVGRPCLLGTGICTVIQKLGV